MQFLWIMIATLAGLRGMSTILFVAMAGAIQGRKLGRWPTLHEWCLGLALVRLGRPGLGHDGDENR